MISLPSTTKVNQKLPKEAFYRHMKLDAKQKNEFIHGIERITVTNSIKATTVNLKDSEDVHEILVLQVELKKEDLPKLAIEVIAKNNPHKLLFECIFGGQESCAVYRSGEAWFTDWYDCSESVLSMMGESLSDIWDSCCAQVIFNDHGVKDVDAEISKRRRMRQLDAEIAKLERKHGKEKQVAKRNELFKQLRELRNERETLLKEQ